MTKMTVAEFLKIHPEKLTELELSKRDEVIGMVDNPYSMSEEDAMMKLYNGRGFGFDKVNGCFYVRPWTQSTDGRYVNFHKKTISEEEFIKEVGGIEIYG